MDVVNRASLLVVQGVEQGARFELGEQPIAMGRGVQNEVRILDTEVSRLHATIPNRRQYNLDAIVRELVATKRA